MSSHVANNNTVTITPLKPSQAGSGSSCPALCIIAVRSCAVSTAPDPRSAICKSNKGVMIRAAAQNGAAASISLTKGRAESVDENGAMTSPE